MRILLFLVAAISAYCSSPIEAKAGYFFFLNPTMQKIYDGDGIDLQLSGSYPIRRDLHFYASLEYLEKFGHSLNGGQATHLQVAPISIGLKPIYPLTRFTDFYLTAGPRYFIVRVHNDSPYVDNDLRSDGWGGFANIGFLSELYRGLTINLFSEWSYGKVLFNSTIPNVEVTNIQLTGITFGGGLGYTF